MLLSKQTQYLMLGISALVMGFSACKKTSEGKQALSIHGEMQSCSADSVFIYTTDGFKFDKIASAVVVKSGSTGTFEIDASIPQSGFYFIGNAPNNALPIILGGEEDVKVVGNCTNWRGLAKIENSPLNEGFNKLLPEIMALNQAAQLGMQQVAGGATKSMQAGAAAELQKTVDKQKRVLDSLRKVSPLLETAARVMLQPVFNVENNPQRYKNATEHFAKEYFNGVDFNKPEMGYMLPMFEGAATYTRTLAASGIGKDTLEQYLNAVLAKTPAKSQAQKLLLNGIIYGLDMQNAPSFATYAKKYETTFPEDKEHIQRLTARIASIEQQAAAEEKFAIGATPPDFELPDPNGKKVSLSSLKGKVVLLDFWASWCRPCRAENPNNVRMYKKYKAQGFEILGVSLDKGKEEWVQAIADDKLEWLHVSDLQFWQSAAAQLYNVQSIPKTFLLGKDGKILAKDLRGAALEAKLAEVFGK